MHYAKQVYAINESQQEKKQLKWNGSYIHYPLIPQPVSITHRQILKTQVMPTSDNLKSDAGSNGVMKFFSLKDTNSKVKMLYRKHLRIDIKQYLKKKFGKPFHMIPSEGFQCVRLVSSEEQLFKTDVFYLYQPYYLMKNIRITLFKNAQLLTRNIINGLFYELLNLSLQFGGLDNFLMTTSNVFLSDDLENLSLNYNSFVGLTFLKLDDKDAVTVRRNQFFQIYPYLDSKVLSRIPDNSINYTMKIRCFVINCLALILGEDIQFLIEKINEIDIERKSVEDKITNIKKQYEEMLQKNTYKKRIKTYQTKLGIQFIDLFKRVLIDEEDLGWRQIVSYFALENEKNQQDQKVNKAFQELHQWVWEEEKDKKYYQDRKISDISVYIPIKFNANLQQVFKHKHWWNVFVTKYSEVHESFSFKIMNFVAERLKREIGEKKQQESKFFTIQDFSKAGKIILSCWEQKWKQRLSSGTLNLYQFSEKWKDLFK